MGRQYSNIVNICSELPKFQLKTKYFPYKSPKHYPECCNRCKMILAPSALWFGSFLKLDVDIFI